MKKTEYRQMTDTDGRLLKNNMATDCEIDTDTATPEQLNAYLKAHGVNMGSSRRRFEAILSSTKGLASGKTRIVCICGSTRFIGEMAVQTWEFEKRGVIALGPHLLPQWYEGVQEHHQAEAEGVAHIIDELHLRKIDMADEVFVVNVNGYIGERTAAEIAYAKEHGKPVRYLEMLLCPKCGHGSYLNSPHICH